MQSHKLYHRCRDTMYRENQFVVDNFGAGLAYLGQRLGLHWCGIYCCTCPHIGSLKIRVGCDDHDAFGLVKTEGMIQALKDLPHAITVEHLWIELLPWCFVGNADLALFVAAIAEKIEVQKRLDFTGLDVHCDMDLRTLPKALGMKLQPLLCQYEPHNDLRQIQGFFGCWYEPAKNENEKNGLNEDGSEMIIRDFQYFHEIHEMELYHGTAIGY